MCRNHGVAREMNPRYGVDVSTLSRRSRAYTWSTLVSVALRNGCEMGDAVHGFLQMFDDFCFMICIAYFNEERTSRMRGNKSTSLSFWVRK